MKSNKPKASNSTKFDWKKRQSGGPRPKSESMGFDGNLQKKALKKTEHFVEEHKEYRKEIRKPR